MNLDRETGGLTFQDNINNYIHIGSDISIDANMVMQNFGIPWYFEQGLDIDIWGVTLAIEPGTEVLVGNGYSIFIENNSILTAEGTADNPIVFHGLTGIPGDWSGITVDGGELDMAYCTITGSDGNGITLLNGGTLGYQDPNPLDEKIFNNNIIESADSPISSNWISNLQNSNIGMGNTFNSTNGANFIYIATNNSIWTDMTMQNFGIPWYFAQGLDIDSWGVTLAIEPGTKVLVESGYSIYVGQNSTLEAFGTNTDRIIFIGADETMPGYWQGIYIDSNGTALLEYCDISGGGSSNGWGWGGDSCLAVEMDGMAYLRNINISNSGDYGIAVYDDGWDISYIDHDGDGVSDNGTINFTPDSANNVYTWDWMFGSSSQYMPAATPISTWP